MNGPKVAEGTRLALGHNVSTIGGVSGALILTHRMKGSAVQVVLGDMTDRNSIIDLTDEDVQKTNAIKAKYGYYVVVHGKYIYNFCRDWTWQSESLLKELTIANKINTDVIIHQGKNVKELNLTEDEAIAVFAKNVSAVAKKMQVRGLSNRIILENSSRQGNELGYSIKQLKQIHLLIPDDLKALFAFCIDTCHIFVAGEVDWTLPGSTEAFFEEFNREIGLEHLAVVHLNDSAIPFNGRNDHHAGLHCGHIGGGLKDFTRKCYELKIPMILETPCEHIESEIELAKDFLK